MNIPTDREYTESHEWLTIDGTAATLGLTEADPALAAPIEGVELLSAGTSVRKGDKVAEIRTANGSRPVTTPLSGHIVEGNTRLAAAPALLQENPYGEGWLLRLRIEAGEELEHLLEPAEYAGSQRAIEIDI